MAPLSEHLTAVDTSPEVLELNRRRVGLDRVEYVQRDIFRWIPEETYDFIFFGFWLSHVPPRRFDRFWELLGTALRPGGSVFFLDTLFQRDAIVRVSREEDLEVRQLIDGRRFRIIKVFFEADSLQKRLKSLGWDGYVRSTNRYFIYGLQQPDV